MMHGSPVRLTPCSSALLWAEGGPAACWGSCLWKDAEASSLGLYAIFFVGSGQASTRRLGKGLSRIFCIQLSWDMCPKFNFVVLSIPMGWS